LEINKQLWWVINALKLVKLKTRNFLLNSLQSYGTGCFMLMNIGQEVVYSKSGLLTTVGFQFGDSKPIYALEGSVSVCGSGINWLVKNLGLFSSAKECDEAASKVQNSEGVVIVPAFSGLFAPYWNPKAKAFVFYFFKFLSSITGLSFYSTKNHIARAMFEGIAFRIKEVLDLMIEDTEHKVKTKVLKVDGGVSNSVNMLQIQSNLSGIQVERPMNVEMTARGFFRKF
jgi:glycerol kinase